ncbi:MAG: hypothetical protein GXO36_03795 [Chloroflexi bacterium]|nr:hypothetical protein [Chloroflexota bacterium]
MKDARQHASALRALKARRKKGELDLRTYYHQLLQLLSDMLTSLREEDIPDDEVKRQVPLLLVFLEDQIQKYAQRRSRQEH